VQGTPGHFAGLRSKRNRLGPVTELICAENSASYFQVQIRADLKPTSRIWQGMRSTRQMKRSFHV
jgi:hypothetical protein